MNKKNKTKNNEKKIEDATKYGEFIPTFFNWETIKEQKEKVEEMEKMTKNK